MRASGTLGTVKLGFRYSQVICNRRRFAELLEQSSTARTRQAGTSCLHPPLFPARLPLPDVTRTGPGELRPAPYRGPGHQPSQQRPKPERDSDSDNRHCRPCRNHPADAVTALSMLPPLVTELVTAGRRTRGGASNAELAARGGPTCPRSTAGEIGRPQDYGHGRAVDDPAG